MLWPWKLVTRLVIASAAQLKQGPLVNDAHQGTTIYLNLAKV